jgi:uncharacterized membrane protein YjdF
MQSSSEDERMRAWYLFLLIIFLVAIIFFILGGGFTFSFYSYISIFLFAILLAIGFLYFERARRRWWRS